MSNRILIAIFFLTAFNSKTLAQDPLTAALIKDSKKDTKIFTLNSLDGKKQKVHIMPDYTNHVLKISCLKDTISVNDYWGVPADLNILNKNFLSIRYEVRGGSGLGLGNIFILCIKNKTLYESIHILRYSHLEDAGKIKDYRIKSVLIGNSVNTYKLKISIHNSSYSKYVSSDNYNHKNISTLKFDVAQNVFYSSKRSIYKTMMIYDTKTDKEHKQQINGNFPEIILGDQTYYFIKDGWYEMGTNNELYNFTSTTKK